MRHFAKRLIPPAMVAALWAGVATAVLAARKRSPAMRRRSKAPMARVDRMGAARAVLAGLALLGLIFGAALYGGLIGLPGKSPSAPVTLTDSSAAPGLMIRYGCAGCHVISGVPGARGQAGPPLDGFAGRLYIAGALTNGPDNLVRWIVNPRAIDPNTAMPVTGVSQEEARVLAAYLLGAD
jgi:cytochrome c1